MARLPPLTVARCVCESHAVLAATGSDVASLAVSAFLDASPLLSVQRAVDLGSVPLLERVVSTKQAAATNPFLLEHWLTLGAHAAANAAHRDLVERILEYSAQDSDPFWRSSCLEAVIEGAMTGGHVAILDEAVASLGVPRCRALLEHYIQGHKGADQLAVLQWLVAHDIPLPYKPLAAHAARAGALPVVEWLTTIDSREIVGSRILMAAVQSGQPHVVRFLVDECGEYVGSHVLGHAMWGGNVESVRFLDDAAPGMCTPAMLRATILNGHIDVAKMLIARHPALWLQLDAESEGLGLLDTAAASHHSAMLFWVLAYHEEHHPSAPPLRAPTQFAIDDAASFGQLDILQWLYERVHYGWRRHVMDSAARRGHLHVVQWLHTHCEAGCSFQAMNLAARHGHLAVVRWLHENRREGCTTAAMNDAAGNGHLEVVQYLHEHTSAGCTAAAMDQAVRGGHLETALWLQEHRSEGCSRDALNATVDDGYAGPAAIKWLHVTHGVQYSRKAVDSIWKRGWYGLLEWICARGWQGVSQETIAMAMRRGDVYALQWLTEHWPEGMDWPWMEGMAETIGNEHVSTWLRTVTHE